MRLNNSVDVNGISHQGDHQGASGYLSRQVYFIGVTKQLLRRFRDYILGEGSTTETQKHRIMEINDITGKIVDAAVHVHMNLGPGLFEEVYKQCLIIELEKRGLQVRSEVFLPIVYECKLIDMGYRLDLLVESQVIVELKAVNSIAPIHKAQLLTYLKLAQKKLGLLINFNVPTLPEGIVRLIR